MLNRIRYSAFVYLLFIATCQAQVAVPNDDESSLYSLGIGVTQLASIEDAKSNLASRLSSTVSSEVTTETNLKAGKVTSSMRSKSQSKSAEIPLPNFSVVTQEKKNFEWHTVIKINRTDLIQLIEMKNGEYNAQVSAIVSDCTTPGFGCFLKQEKIKELRDIYAALLSVDAQLKQKKPDTGLLQSLQNTIQNVDSANLTTYAFTAISKCDAEMGSLIASELESYFNIVTQNNPKAGSITVSCSAKHTNIPNNYLIKANVDVSIKDENGILVYKGSITPKSHSFNSSAEAKELLLLNSIKTMKPLLEEIWTKAKL